MSESAPDPALLAVAINVASALQKYRYIINAVYAIQIWEWLICFSDEHDYVHKARWTTVKVAFLYCRYFPLVAWPYVIWGWVADHPRPGCPEIADTVSIMLPFFTVPPVLVFIIRAYAFTGRRKIILAILLAGWIALFVAYVVRNIVDYNGDIMELQALFGHDSACLSVQKDAATANHHYFPLTIYSICALVFDTLVMALVFIHCIRFRTFWGPLGKSFVVQTLMAYVVLVAVQLCFMIVMASPDIQWDVLIVFSDIIPNVIACRLILLLRRQVNPSRSTEDRLASEMVRDALGRLPPTINRDDDTDEDHHQVIERWD